MLRCEKRAKKETLSTMDCIARVASPRRNRSEGSDSKKMGNKNGIFDVKMQLRS